MTVNTITVKTSVPKVQFPNTCGDKSPRRLPLIRILLLRTPHEGQRAPPTAPPDTSSPRHVETPRCRQNVGGRPAEPGSLGPGSRCIAGAGGGSRWVPRPSCTAAPSVAPSLLPHTAALLTNQSRTRLRARVTVRRGRPRSPSSCFTRTTGHACELESRSAGGRPRSPARVSCGRDLYPAAQPTLARARV